MNAHTLPSFLCTSHRPFLLRHLTVIIIKDTCCTAVNVGQPCETPQKYIFTVISPFLVTRYECVCLVPEVSLIVIILYTCRRYYTPTVVLCSGCGTCGTRTRHRNIYFCLTDNKLFLSSVRLIQFGCNLASMMLSDTNLMMDEILII